MFLAVSHPLSHRQHLIHNSLSSGLDNPSEFEHVGFEPPTFMPTTTHTTTIEQYKDSLGSAWMDVAVADYQSLTEPPLLNLKTSIMIQSLERSDSYRWQSYKLSWVEPSVLVAHSSHHPYPNSSQGCPEVT